MSKKTDVSGLVSEIGYDKIIQFYINENHTKQETAIHFSITMDALSKIFSRYEIKKSKADIVKKRQATNLERYGVDNPRKSEAIKTKIRQTNQERYGAVTFTASQAGKDQIKQTKLDHFGDANFNNMEANKATKQKRYGDTTYNNRDKNRQTCQERYGVDHGGLLPKAAEGHRANIAERLGYTELFTQLLGDRDKAVSFLKDKHYSLIDLMPLFNAPYYTVQAWVTRLDLKEWVDISKGTSQYEKQVLDFLYGIGVVNIVQHDREVLQSGQEIDLFLPDYHLGIEVNGDYWHSSLFKQRSYHLAKSKQAERQGIRLIHIYEYEWCSPSSRKIIESILQSACGKTSRSIFARRCELKKVTKEEAKTFINQNHLQGYRHAQITYGLYFQDELVQLMSFSRHAKYQWEIIRGCTKLGCSVVGGISRIIKHFKEDQAAKSLFSYCDFNKYDGRGYQAIGMTCIGYTDPNLSYLINGEVVPRRVHHYKEDEAACDAKLWGAGSKKYLWRT